MYCKPLVLLLLLLLASACASSRSYVAPTRSGQQPESLDDAAFRVFLIGNTGGRPNAQVLQTLKARLQSADAERAAVVFLGDNVAAGLADSASASRQADEAPLRMLLETVEGFQGRVIVIPGEGDWAGGRKGGLEALARQERFLESRASVLFLPDDGFPGPAEIKLTDRITLLAVDTQWWIHPSDKSTGDDGKYDLEERADFIVELEDAVARNRKRSLLVVGHHPIVSVGGHAGFKPARDHLFPLASAIPGAYVPLPVVGSLYPLYVRLLGGRQDLSHPDYTSLRTGLVAAFSSHERLAYASAHDRGMQYFVERPPYALGAINFIVSGGGSEGGTVGAGALYANGSPGFAEVLYREDGSEWLIFRGADGESLFQTELNGPLAELVDAEVAETAPAFRDSSVVVAANPGYSRSRVQRFMLGSHHRDAWATPVRVPVLDLDGLQPVKRGGGQQTLSLRMVDEEGNEYVLRSIDKDPSKSVPAAIHGTVATDIVQDQISSIHPFGAFIVPTLAGAAGVYHTEPKLVYLPKDPRLGIYKEFFGERLMMLEERPDGDESARPNFGRSRDVISAAKLYREVNGDNDHRVDQRFFLRSRLFDMLLSDWDRHRDQWRWASFEPYELDSLLQGEERKRGKIYRPIPRDRDWAFNRLSGLPSLAKHFIPRFQVFKEGYGNLKGLTLNGLEQDRRFLNEMTRADYVRAAKEIRTALTDDVIDRAVRSWPEAIYDLHGAEIASILKIRRDALPDVAHELYDLQARVVDVVGTQKHERFEVEHVGDSVRVTVFKTKKNGDVDREVYRRTFVKGETREIRLFGQAGNDQFHVTGRNQAGIKIRAIGGGDDDVFAATEGSRGARFYDTSYSGNTWNVGPGVRVFSSSDPSINRYEPREFKHNVTLPVTYFGSNDDEGLFVGGGARIIRHGFRKSPYAAEHVVKANIAAKTLGFNLSYDGHFVGVAGPLDVMLNAAYFSPDNIRNFHGLGNESENTDKDRKFYQARLTDLVVSPSLYRRIKDVAAIYAGPFVHHVNVRRDEDRFVALPQEGISRSSFDPQWLVGARAGVLVEALDSKFNPMSGIRWGGDGTVNVNASGSGERFSTLSTALAAYYSPSISPQVTLAARVGGAHNVGDFPFYSAVTLGSKSNLRGFRSTRFAGRTSFYQNFDLRIELFRYSTYLAIGKGGVHGFMDNGRIWTDGERSKVWHQGYGGGLWFEMFGLFVFQGTAGFSEDDRTLTIGVGFLY